MLGPELTASTVLYLFASEWAAPADSSLSMSVPGANVDAAVRWAYSSPND